MVKITVKSTFPILLFLLISAQISVQACPTCLGRVTKTSPAFFKNIIYKDPSYAAKATKNGSSIESIEKQSKIIQALAVKYGNQKI